MIKIMDKRAWRMRAIDHAMELTKVKKQLAIAVEALERYATGTDTMKSIDAEGTECEYEYPLTNDDGETAKVALAKIKEIQNEKSTDLR